MNADDFVRQIETHVRDVAIDATIANLERPPGRAPQPELLEASEWYASLSGDERKLIAYIVRRTSNHAVLGFLTVLDGARAIDYGNNLGRIEVTFVSDASRRLLSDGENQAPLNEKFRS